MMEKGEGTLREGAARDTPQRGGKDYMFKELFKKLIFNPKSHM